MIVPMTARRHSRDDGRDLPLVSRVLSAWEQQGLVESGRQRIIACRCHASSASLEAAPAD